MHKKKYAFLEYAVYVFILVFVLFIAPKYLVEKILVDGTSMECSLYNGQQVLIEKVSRNFNGPDRFDIVVFTKNHGTYTKTYIKRVIGLPGESIQIIGDRIFVNGKEIEEDFGKDPMDSAGIASPMGMIAQFPAEVKAIFRQRSCFPPLLPALHSSGVVLK